MNKRLIQKIRERSLHLLREGIADDPAVREKGTVQDPLPGYDGDRNSAYWFIGVTVENKIAGFIVLDADLRIEKYWAYCGTEGSFDQCPDADIWMNPDRVVDRARTKAYPGAILSPPYLTFDQASDRVVWAVNITGQVKKTVYVDGDYVYFSDRSASR